MGGTVRAIGRFPVKSMQGESPSRARVGENGVRGDRTHGLLDVRSGKLASAKDPRAWGQLLEFRAARLPDDVEDGPVEITLPDGSRVRSDDADVDAALSAATGREVRLSSVPPPDVAYDYVWEVDDIAPAEMVTGSQTGTSDEGFPVSTMPIAMMAPGTFQDVAPITILTTSALAAMTRHYPRGAWDPARFRSNLLLEPDDGEDDDAEVVENEWQGRQLRVGGVVLEVTAASPRCVMTTLAQPGLPRDREILRTVARHNRIEFGSFGLWACLGVYARVVTPGEVAVGDSFELL